MNMLQSMKIYLAGYEPLQNIILMYCLGTPTATVMKPLCNLAKEKRQQKEHSEDEATAWRYYNPEVKSTNTMKKNWSFLGWTITEEIRGFKIQDTDTRRNHADNVERFYKTNLNIKLHELAIKETNGTPTGIIVRKYMTNLFGRGFKLMENETMWARFSCGELLCFKRRPLTIVRVNNSEVLDDLNKAMKEIQAQYSKNRGNINNF